MYISAQGITAACAVAALAWAALAWFIRAELNRFERKLDKRFVRRGECMRCVELEQVERQA